jgi:2-isopropylmalate synthase
MAKYHQFPRVDLKNRTWPDNQIDTAPIWCSVDLRDGNQALAVPMSVEEKLEMFQLLVDIGFKEIEVGFPSASDIEFEFIRRLIEEDRVPGDVWLQVLTQAREHLIRRTFESLEGASRAILHLYNSTSALQREVTFRMSKEQIKGLAVEGTKLVKSLLPEMGNTRIRFEYSPESFSDTEVDYALEVCEAVMDVWQPTVDDRMILNLPATVEMSTPNIYADQIEWFCTNMKDREKAIVSLHTHNDRGTGVAATELGLMAGADRVEGTLFGNGERTGNLDLVTLALNMFSQGVETGLDLSDLPKVQRVFEKVTGMRVPPRQPYAGELVFTAFSGSHQDAIKKGMDQVGGDEESGRWRVPYLPIDPADIGRTYKAIIRINSQSGKGGVAYVLSREYGLELPKKMHPVLGKLVNSRSDEIGKELTAEQIYDIFKAEFLNLEKPVRLEGFKIIPKDEHYSSVTCEAEVERDGKLHSVTGTGNGPIDAFVHALEQKGWKEFDVLEFHEQSVGTGSQTEALAYIMIQLPDGQKAWGAGMHTNITAAGMAALLSAFNRHLTGSLIQV